MKETIYVIGHKNPDTDSICSAIAYANLKNQLCSKYNYVAARAGKISDETAYPLEYFKAEDPEFVEELKEGQKVIFVDHNEATQCVDGYDKAEILEIMDHHKIGSLQTANPIYFRNEPVGCTATIVTKMYKENGIEIPEKIAGLLISAILSDTLVFRSPTCTEKDVEIAKELAKIADIDYEKYAEKMFEAGECLDGKSEADLLFADYKVFENEGMKFGVGQGSFMSAANMKKVEEMLVPYMDSQLGKDGVSMIFYMLTDIREESSLVLFAGEGAKETLEKGFEVTKNAEDDGIMLKGVVSRKKQMIPSLLKAL